MAKAGCGCDIPYCRKLTLEINATWINVNLVENDVQIKEINAREMVTFQNEGNIRDAPKETTETKSETSYNLEWKPFCV